MTTEGVMTGGEPIFYDRSRVSLDWRCPRARWWGNEFESLGIVPFRRALYFDIGDAYHKGVAALKAGGDVEEVVNDNLPPFRRALEGAGILEDWKISEQCALVEGMIRGYAKHVLPRLLQEFAFIAMEEEFCYDHDGCRQGVRPDSLAERRSDKTLWYLEDKSTGSIGEKWFPQWPKAIQLHSTAVAVGAHLGREVEGIIVLGAYKGYEREGRMTSIFCYGYERPGTIGGPDLCYEWKPGSRRRPTWEMVGGVRCWIEDMPEEILANQFVQTPPIFLQKRLSKAFFDQTALREQEIAKGREAFYATKDPEVRRIILDEVFPQHFDQCSPPIGSPCAWGDCCFNPHIADNPLSSGLYTWREPHHSTDQRGLSRLVELRGGMVIK